MNTIQIEYSCKHCGIKDRKIDVRMRNQNRENVIEWMQGPVVQTVSFDHRQQSPLCKATHIDEVKIPYTGVEYIGGPAVN
jgi:hypothetical protein